MMHRDQRFTLAADVVLQVIDDEALLLNLHDETIFSLNETGARIAQLMSDGKAVSQVVDILSEEYCIDREAIVREIRQLVEDLTSRGLIVLERIRGGK